MAGHLGGRRPAAGGGHADRSSNAGRRAADSSSPGTIKIQNLNRIYRKKESSDRRAGVCSQREADCTATGTARAGDVVVSVPNDAAPGCEAVGGQGGRSSRCCSRTAPAFARPGTTRRRGKDRRMRRETERLCAAADAERPETSRQTRRRRGLRTPSPDEPPMAIRPARRARARQVTKVTGPSCSVKSAPTGATAITPCWTKSGNRLFFPCGRRNRMLVVFALKPPLWARGRKAPTRNVPAGRRRRNVSSNRVAGGSRNVCKAFDEGAGALPRLRIIPSSIRRVSVAFLMA